MDFSPVIIPTLNRYEHLKKCIDSLLQNKYAELTELYIGLDFPPAEKYQEGYSKVFKYISGINGFKNVVVIKRTHNYGAIENIKDLIRLVLQTHESFIFSEDDNVFSPCFLEYIHTGLEKYKNDYTILSVSGYAYPVIMPDSENTVIKMQRYYSDWGFGMWKDRYEMLRDTIKQTYFDMLFLDRKKTETLRKLSRKNYVYAFGLCTPSKANIRPMDYTSSIFQIVNNMYSIMPKVSLVRNEGWDNTGLHCQDTDKRNRRLQQLFIRQPVSEKKSFGGFICSEKESFFVNQKINESIIGNYEIKTYLKVRVKVILLRMGLWQKIKKRGYKDE
jgi:hypothetical protein